MVTKLVAVCDRHAEDVPATHHNEWVNLEGKPKENDLCDEHQEPFLAAWEVIEAGSNLSTRAPAAKPAPAKPKRVRPPRGEHTQSSIIRAWAKSVGMEVSDQGRVGFHIEQAWKEAGRPAILPSDA
ncbi:histone-like nucleoid-structuring protein Lsr2 [Acrocarpospora sp. B8E8]|uniref:Lsr2 family DNA-binding protein n=1 Tax=Acrocarpospora sp. B8E8 TaxID=3153572 RepID=UPI00325C5DC2